MKANYRAAASAGLLLSACANVGHAATTIQTTTIGPQAASSNFDVLFSTPILSVSDLVSISDGSVNTGEGATLSISAILTNDQVVQIYSELAPPFQTNVPLSDLTGNEFTDFAIPQDVKGLRFSSAIGQTGFNGTFTLPALTVVTLAVVPEPAAAIMMLLGCLFLAIRRRRMVA